MWTPDRGAARGRRGCRRAPRRFRRGSRADRCGNARGAARRPRVFRDHPGSARRADRCAAPAGAAPLRGGGAAAAAPVRRASEDRGICGRRGHRAGAHCRRIGAVRRADASNRPLGPGRLSLRLLRVRIDRVAKGDCGADSRGSITSFDGSCRRSASHVACG